MNRKWYLIIIGCVLLVPIIINLMASTALPFGGVIFTPVGEGKDWVAFFGSYIGAILGGLVAFLIARIQINSTKKENDRLQTIEKRIYVNYSQIKWDLFFMNEEALKNHRLLITEEFNKSREEIIKKDNRMKLEKKDLDITHMGRFLQFKLLGESNVAFNLQISIKLNGEYKRGEKELTELNFRLLTVATDEVILIPIIEKPYLNYAWDHTKIHHEDNFDIKKIEVEYTNVMNENIKFEVDLINNKQLYYTVGKEGHLDKFLEYEFDDTTKWLYLDKKV